jgi:hypothetical protein
VVSKYRTHSSIFLSLRSFIQGIRPGPRLFEHVRNKLIFYGEELSAPRPTPKLEDHPLSALHECLFDIFTATLHTWRSSPLSATWGLTRPWWGRTQLTWSEYRTLFLIWRSHSFGFFPLRPTSHRFKMYTLSCRLWDLYEGSKQYCSVFGYWYTNCLGHPSCLQNYPSARTTEKTHFPILLNIRSNVFV